MTADIVHLSDHRPVTEADVDKAWSDFEAMSAELLEDNSVIVNRAWFSEYTRRQARFQKLFLALEGA